MKMCTPAVLVLLLASTGAAEAQGRFPTAPPKTWVSGMGLMYTDIARVLDPDTDSRWIFDDQAFGIGAGIHRQVIPGLAIGLEGTWASVEYQQWQETLAGDAVIGSGNAALGTALATGRYGSAGAASIGFYLSGGLGAVGYKLEDLDWNADFALHAGTGLEYRFRTSRAVALEWGRIWGYHEKDDLGGGRQTHSVLRLAARLGF